MERKVLPGVERYFQLALLGLFASGYLAIAGSGYVDSPTVILAGIGLLWRTAIVLGAKRLVLPERVVTIATLAYMGFAPLDYFLLSHTWVTATVHVVYFVAGVKLLTARVGRDYLFVAVVAFIELLAAALFSSSGTFFICLSAYLFCAVAALSASEVRRFSDPRFSVARPARSRVSSRLAGLAVVMTCGILILTAGLFFLLPRTANAALRFLASNRYHLTGFSNDVTLGDVGELKSDPRPVMHVRALPDGFASAGGPRLPLNLKWRGLALERFDGRRWSTDPASFRILPQDHSGLLKVGDDWQRRRNGKRILYRVDIQNVDADALFVAGVPEWLNVGTTRVARAPSGALRLGYSPSDTVRYEVYGFFGDGGAADSHPEATLPAAEREQDLKIPRIDSRIAPLARAMTRGAHTDRERAQWIESRLRHDYGYSLDLPSTEPRDPIATFLFDRRTGYCEYFASAMTIMLRTVGIPARLVNGFQSGIANPYSGTLVIRASDAHTWVEAFLPGSGWTVFDPTPPGGTIPAQTMWTRVSLFLDAADTFWRDWVLSYDLGQQLTLASRVELGARNFRENGMLANLLDGRVWTTRLNRFFRNTWFSRAAEWALGIFAMTFLAVFAFRRWKSVAPVKVARTDRVKPKDATVLYSRMLDLMRRRGYQKPVWFTAREFAESVRSADGRRPSTHTIALEELERFTAAYYALRFGGDRAAARDMAACLEHLAK